MQPAKLDIAQHPSSNGTVVAHLTGKLSLETVNGFLQELRQVASDKLVLDMSGISFLDSAGVGALVLDRGSMGLRLLQLSERLRSSVQHDLGDD